MNLLVDSLEKNGEYDSDATIFLLLNQEWTCLLIALDVMGKDARSVEIQGGSKFLVPEWYTQKFLPVSDVTLKNTQDLHLGWVRKG